MFVNAVRPCSMTNILQKQAEHYFWTRKSLLKGKCQSGIMKWLRGVANYSQ